MAQYLTVIELILTKDQSNSENEQKTRIKEMKVESLKEHGICLKFVASTSSYTRVKQSNH